MKRQTTVLLSILVATLMFGLFITPSPTLAITKVTPTPAPAEDDSSTTELDVETLLERAISKLDDEDFEGAISDLDTIIDIDETLWDAYFFRGFAQSEIGDFDRAIDDYTRAINIRPYDWATYSLRGDLYLQTGDLAQANLDYDQTLYLNPRYFQAYAGKALLNLQRGDESLALIYQGIFESIGASAGGEADDAIDILSATIENITESPSPKQLGYVYYNRANLNIGQQNWDNAIDDMNNAIELQPDMQDYYMARGFAYSETDQLALAAPDFYTRMMLVELNPIDGTIDFGETEAVDMDYGVVARLTFDGEVGQTITLTARDSLGVGVDPLLVLLDVDGNPIAGNDDGGGELDSRISDYTLPDNGTYTAVISHANGGFVGTVVVSLK